MSASIRPNGRIVLVRHGHVDGINPPFFRGRADLPLTATGIRQAEATGAFLAGWPRPAAVYASPLSRCLRTAEEIATPHRRAVAPLAGFIDWDYGLWQGKSFAAVKAAERAAFARWRVAPHRAQVPGGETLLAVAARVAEVLRTIAARHQGETAVLVGHDSVNRVLVLLALDLPLSRYWSLVQSPCGISVLEEDGADGWSALCLNTTEHLRDAMLAP